MPMAFRMGQQCSSHHSCFPQYRVPTCGQMKPAGAARYGFSVIAFARFFLEHIGHATNVSKGPGCLVGRTDGLWYWPPATEPRHRSLTTAGRGEPV